MHLQVGLLYMITTKFPRPSPLGRKRKHESLKSNADNYLNLEYLHVDADILIVFVQDVLKLVHVWNKYNSYSYKSFISARLVVVFYLPISVLTRNFADGIIINDARKVK